MNQPVQLVDADASGSSADRPLPAAAPIAVIASSASEKQSGSEPRSTLGPRDIVLTIAALGAWGFFFTAGLLVDSRPLREALLNPVSLGAAQALSYFAVAFGTYTITNTAILGCLAGLIGAMGRCAALGPDSEVSIPIDGTHPYLSGVLRGFFIYLAMLSGMLILLEDPFSSPSMEQYVRLAGLISIFSFMVSYNPALFSSFLSRMGGFMEGRSGGKTA